MLLIVAHHYVINSGVAELIKLEPMAGKSIFLSLLGAWGKTGINCFMLITGYFMCTSSISVRKFLRLLLEMVFYTIAIYGCFVATGYEKLSVMGLVNALLPVKRIGSNFGGCFLMFYLIIPLLNILIRNMSRQQHEYLLTITGFIYILLGTIRQVMMNYVSWFIVLYFIGLFTES